MRPATILTFFVAAMGFVPTTATACQWRVSLTDRETQEVKYYVPTSAPVELDLAKSGVHVRCVVLPPSPVPGMEKHFTGVRMICSYPDGQFVESVGTASNADPSSQQQIFMAFSSKQTFDRSRATPQPHGRNTSHQVYELAVKCK